MSDNIVEITSDSSSQYSLEISTSLEANNNNVTIDLANSSNVNVDIINNSTVLVGDLPQGYPLSWTIGNLPISRVSGLEIIGGSGISVNNNGSGVFTVAATGQFGLTGEEVDDRINNLIIGTSGISISYNDDNNLLYITTTGSNVIAGSGLLKTNDSIDIISADPSRIVVSADNIDLAQITQSDSSASSSVLINYINRDAYGRILGVRSGPVPNAGFTNLSKGIAFFSSGNFDVVAGGVSLKHSGISIGNTNIVLGQAQTEVSGLNTIISNSGNFNTLLISGIPISGIYQPLLSNPVVGIGTSGSTARWINSNTLSSGSISDSLSKVIITNPIGVLPTSELAISGHRAFHTLESDDSAFALSAINFRTPQQNAYIQFYGKDTIVAPYKNKMILSSSGGLIFSSNAYILNPQMSISESGISVGKLIPGSQFDVVGTGKFSQNLLVNDIPVSLSGHSHVSSDIIDFNSSVSGLIPNNLVKTTGNQSIAGNKNFTDTIYFGSGLNEAAILLYSSPSFAPVRIQNDNGNFRLDVGNNEILTVNETLASINGTLYADNLSVSGLAIINDIPISISGHAHSSSDITNFNSSVSGLLPVKNLVSGSGISVSNNSGTYTIAVTGNFGLTSEEVDDRVSELLSAGTGIALNYNDLNNTLTISTSGLAFTSGANFSSLNVTGVPVSISGHKHLYSDITNFNSGVQDSLTTTLLGGSFINLNYDSALDTLTINSTGLQPSGNYSVIGHSHIINDVSGLQTALDSKQPSGFYASGVHNHGNISTSGTIVGSTSDQVLITDINGIITVSDYAPRSHTLYDSVNNWDILSFTDATPIWSSEAILNDVPIQFRDSILAASLNHSHGNLSSSGTLGSTSGLLAITDNSGILTTTSGINSSYIINFNSSVSGLLPFISGIGYINSNFANNIYTISATGLQPSGNYSVVGHPHTITDITNFSSGVNILVSGIYQPLLTNPVTGIGNGGYLARWIDNNTIGSGLIYDDLSTVYITKELTNANVEISGTSSFIRLYSTSGTNTGSSLILGHGQNDAASIAWYSANHSTPNFRRQLIYNSPSGMLFLAGSNILTPALSINSSKFIGIGTYTPNFQLDVNGTGNFRQNLLVNNVPVSLSGHTHSSANITNFNSTVSGLLPTITGSGYVNSSFSNNIYTISVSGLQPSGNYSVVGHTHTSSDITDFNSAVSGLLPVKNIIGGSGIQVGSVSGEYTITTAGLAASSASSLITEVYNNTGSTIPKMSVVYINGGQGNLPTIALAVASGESGSSRTYGITAEEISANNNGDVVIIGTLIDIDTNQFGAVEGTTLYLSPTVPGGITTVKPLAPNHLVTVGTIVRNHNNQGVIEVRIQNGFELYELHDVKTSGVSDGQFLQYNSGSGLWVPSSSGNFSTLQVNGTGVSISGHSHSSSDITDLNSSVSGLLPPNIVTGVGTSDYLSRWNGSNSVTSGIIFDNGSRIGINTTTPSGQLHVVGTGIVSFLGVGNPAPSSVLDVIGESRIQGLLYFNQNNTDANDSSRNRCSIQRSAGQNLFLTGGSNSIQLAGDGGKILIRSSSVGTEIGGDGANTYVSFHPGSNVERARITPAGFLGIGTSTPSGQLHVVGTGIISSKIGIGTNTPTFDLDVRTNSDNAFYVAQGSGTRFLSFGSTGFINNTTLSVSKSTWNSLATIELSTTAASRRGLVVEQVASQTANAIETRSNTATVLSYINSSGGAYFASNVGVGTSTPTRQLHIIGTGLIASATGLPANALLDVYSTTSGEMVFNVEGTNGSLFSVIDNLSGSLMSVNNNAGLPVFEVFSDDSIIAGRFNQNDFVISSGGNIGIGKAIPSVKLDIVGGVAVSGAFAATTKSFKIDHPSKTNHTLEYGSLESPYHGVRLTGRGVVSKGRGVVELPDYLKHLIHDDDTINIQLTNLYHDKILYVSDIDLSNDKFEVCAKRAKTLSDLQFCWTLTGIRKDVEHLQVERDK